MKAARCTSRTKGAGAFEVAHEGFWYANELTCLPVYLANNLNLNWDRAKKVARLMASI